MKKFAVIGLGRFGSRLAVSLAAAGQEVIAIDRNRRIVEEIRDRVTLAVSLDVTDEDALKSQGVHNVDVAIVGIGCDFEAAALATVILKHLGVKRVITRAVSAIGARILGRIGADEVVKPEDEAADRWALRLSSPGFLHHFELAAGHSMVEIKTPKPWVGQSLSQLHLRSTMKIQVVAIRRPAPAEKGGGGISIELPTPNTPLGEDDLLIILGRDVDLAKMPVHEND